MAKKIILISCASQQGSVKTKAKHLYTSPLFRLSWRYANKRGPDKIFILSGLHYLLDIDKEIAPYDVTLSNVSKAKRRIGQTILTSKEKLNWGKEIIGQLSKETDLQNDEFIVLAGQEYIKPIIKDILRCENPLEGLRIGERLKFLKEN
ncbi:DUF6884 domain-containing protein [Chryseobacterium sp. BIGb0232]|uniref:DUF6884 domain-containing protein n=1 Tax=Chryseobacterium sp. BIGb0232 TaxID=2940598 RepID=UPI000F49F308|nr:DUF6884 domain-containing protein [Chryseobacterium sp. BIGb0232]MCS4301928.1 hypothetical protein [Chryseobacterium sp. BIGb0232]ROS17874.1 hypothetical protein EDF65_2261 [Chryseobacterium nakagawai]